MSHKEDTHPLLAAIEHIHRVLPDAAAVLITTVADKDGTTLSTTTEAMTSLSAVNVKLNAAETYALEVIERQKGILEPHKSFSFTIIEYIPLSKQLCRKIEGSVETKWLH